MSLSMILKFFFNFGRFEPCDSYKLYSYKKESVYCNRTGIDFSTNDLAYQNKNSSD